MREYYTEEAYYARLLKSNVNYQTNKNQSYGNSQRIHLPHMQSIFKQVHNATKFSFRLQLRMHGSRSFRFFQVVREINCLPSKGLSNLERFTHSTKCFYHCISFVLFVHNISNLASNHFRTLSSILWLQKGAFSPICNFKMGDKLPKQTATLHQKCY